MSTTNITIDRATRDVLCEELLYVLKGAGTSLAECIDVSRGKAEEAIEKAQWAFGVRDALGWDAEDPRKLYELRVDGELASWIRTVRSDFAELLGTESKCLARLEAGDEARQHIGYSMAESVINQRKVVGVWETDLALLDRLMEMLDGTVAAVA